MNRNLIFKLSLFGLAMALGTVFFISSKIEPFFWLIIFILCAMFVAKQADRKYFLHGFYISLLNSVWITAIHVILFKFYVQNHPEEMQMMTTMPLPTHPRIMMLITGPIVGVISGLVLGLFCWLAYLMVKKTH